MEKDPIQQQKNSIVTIKPLVNKSHTVKVSLNFTDTAFACLRSPDVFLILE